MYLYLDRYIYIQIDNLYLDRKFISTQIYVFITREIYLYLVDGYMLLNWIIINQIYSFLLTTMGKEREKRGSERNRVREWERERERERERKRGRGRESSLGISSSI